MTVDNFFQAQVDYHKHLDDNRIPGYMNEPIQTPYKRRLFHILIY